MLAQAVHEQAAPRRDPEEVALELLQSELGARRIDGG
jgi:DNA polymerase-3 subunit gamma/tau